MNYKNINPYIIGNLLRFYHDEIIGREGFDSITSSGRRAYCCILCSVREEGGSRCVF